MSQARPLIFGAALLALAVPGHPLAVLPGLPLGLAGIVVGIYAGAGRWNARGAAAGLVIAGVAGLLTLRELSYDLTIERRTGAPIVLSFSPWGWRFPVVMKHLHYVADRINALVVEEQRRQGPAAFTRGRPTLGEQGV